MPQITPAPELGAVPRLSALGRDGSTWVKLPAKPDAVWHYTKADGESFGYAIRWNETDEYPKVCRPLVWGTDEKAKDPKKREEVGWQWMGFSNPRPLLYLPAIFAKPVCPVLVVEGEKAADGARRYLPAGWEVTTWQGGTSNFQYADWSALGGHSVVIWPDNDDAGAVCAAKLLQLLQDSGISSAIVDLPKNLPEKYDLGDDLPEGMTGDGLKARILKTAKACLANSAATPAQVTPTARQEAAAGVDGDIRIQCLGHRDRKYYFLAHETQTLLFFSGRELQDKKALRELCTDDQYWYKIYGSSGDNFAWDRVGADLMDQCHRAGIYDPDNLRGRGCWIDQGRVVFHGGDRLLVDGVPCEPIAIQSDFIYQKLPRFFDIRKTTALTKNEGTQIAKVCRSLPWKKMDALTADLFCGLIATAQICGALRFRSHGWLTGPTGAGKSWAIREFAYRCIGAMSVRPLGNSSEAGIRQRLRSEAVPVLFDEAEAHGVEGEQKRQMIIQMMRASSQDSGGELYKGTTGHASQSFKIQSQFLLASIGVGLVESADVNRCLVLTLDNPVAATPEQQEARQKSFEDIEKAISALPVDLPQKLLCRMLKFVNQVRDLADWLATYLMKRLGKSTIRRVGDLLAAPLAGMWFLTHDKAPKNEAELGQWLDRYNMTPWEGGNDMATSDEGVALLQYLTDQEVRVEFGGGGGGNRTVGALLANLALFEPEDKVSFAEAARALNTVGMKFDRHEKLVYMASNNSNLARIMRNAPFGSGYISILKRRDGVRTSEKPMHIGNKTNRPLMIPLEAFLGDYKNTYVPDAFPRTARNQSSGEPPMMPGWETADEYVPGQDG